MLLNKYKGSKSFNNYIIFFICVLLVSLIFLSGCVNFCKEDSSDESLESENYSCINIFEAREKCNEISLKPNNYPICADFSKFKKEPDVSDCAKNYNEISEKIVFKNLSSKSNIYINAYRSNLISSWESSDKIAYNYVLINNTCNDLYDLEFSDYKTKIKNNLLELDNHNNLAMQNFTLSLFSIKNDLLEYDPLLMPNTQLYFDYIELNNIINEYQKLLGKNIDIKESISNKTFEFYFKYYVNENTKNELNVIIDTLNSQENYISDYSSFLTYGLLLSSSFALSDISLIINAFSGTNSIVKQVSNLIESIIHKTNLNEWNKLEFLKTFLLDFESAHGKNSLIDKSYFDLVKKIDEDISVIKQENKLYKKEYLIKTKELREKIESKLIGSNNYSLLYEKYNLKSKPQELLSNLKNIEYNLDFLDANSLGEQHVYLKSLKYILEDLEDEITNYNLVDFTTLVSLCSADLINEKQNVLKIEDSKKRTILQNYLNYFFESKENEKKVLYCNKYFEILLYSENTDCINQYENLNNNLNLNTKPNKNVLLLAQNTKEFNLLKEKYFIINSKLELLEKLLNSKECVNLNDYSIIKKDYFALFERESICSDNKLLNIFLLEQNISEYYNYLNDFELNLNTSLNKGLSYYFEENYEIDNNSIKFNNYLGKMDLDFNIILNNEFISEIIPKDCLRKVSEKFNLEFKCLNENMNYNILLINEDITYKTKAINVNSNYGVLQQEVCFTKILNHYNYIDIPIDEKHISQVIISDDIKTYPSKIEDSKIKIVFENLSPKKKCVYVNYSLINPIELNYTLNSFENNIYTYDLKLKNNLNITLNKINLTIPNLQQVNNNSQIKLYSDKEYDVNIQNQLIYFKIDLLYAKQEKNLTIVFENNSYDIEKDITNLIKDIAYLEKFSWITEEKILELNQEIVKINKESVQYKKIKLISSLRAKINNLLGDCVNNSILMEKRNLELTKIFNLQKQYAFAIKKLEKDYNVKINSNLEFSILNDVLDNSNNLYSLGDIQGSLKVLEQLKLDTKSLDSAILKLYDSENLKFKELEKNAKTLNLDYSIFSNNFSKIQTNLSNRLYENDYNSAFLELDNYKSELVEFNTFIKDSTKDTNKINKDTIAKYKLYKENLNDFWKKYALLEDSFNSDHYQIIKKLGINFNFDPKDLTTVKKTLTSMSKDIVNLDSVAKEYEKNTIGLFLLSKDYDAFFYDYDLVLQSFDIIEQDLKDIAKTELLFVANKIDGEAPLEFYKAKDYYDSNNYIESIYYSKLSLMDKKSSNNNISIYLGLGFVILLGVLYILFRKKLEFPKKEQPKETYYNIEKEE